MTTTLRGSTRRDGEDPNLRAEPARGWNGEGENEPPRGIDVRAEAIDEPSSLSRWNGPNDDGR